MTRLDLRLLLKHANALSLGSHAMHSIACDADTHPHCLLAAGATTCMLCRAGSFSESTGPCACAGIRMLAFVDYANFVFVAVIWCRLQSHIFVLGNFSCEL